LKWPVASRMEVGAILSISPMGLANGCGELKADQLSLPIVVSCASCTESTHQNCHPSSASGRDIMKHWLPFLGSQARSVLEQCPTTYCIITETTSFGGCASRPARAHIVQSTPDGRHTRRSQSSFLTAPTRWRNRAPSRSKTAGLSSIMLQQLLVECADHLPDEPCPNVARLRIPPH